MMSRRVVTATEAGRNFFRLLDEVEHHGERLAIVRHGRVVARLEPAPRASGADVKALLHPHRSDADWAGELASLRADLVAEDRP
jgi:prevent-host-death family protein